MRLGIFGGTFDPPHVGHLLAALDAADQLGLDRLLFVPAAVQPLKRDRDTAPPEARLAMTQLLAAGTPGFDVSAMEVERPGVSFTADTLGQVAEAYPGADRWLLLGADALALFGQWREPARVLELARLAILARGDEPAVTPAGVDASRLQWLRTRRVDISSTEIRARVRAGQSIRGFVTDGVAEYIARHGLYR